MTSNMGAEVILENFEDLQEVGEDHRQDILDTTREEVFNLLMENLRPEFLNRIDEKIMFLPLTLAEIKKILNLKQQLPILHLCQWFVIMLPLKVP